MLDGFKAFSFNSQAPYVSVTNNGMTFNKSVVTKLGYPETVVLLIDDIGRRIAVQVCDRDTNNAVNFYKPRKTNSVSVRWNGRELLNTIQSMMDWDLSKDAYKIEGEMLKDEHAILFELGKAVPLYQDLNRDNN